MMNEAKTLRKIAGLFKEVKVSELTTVEHTIAEILFKEGWLGKITDPHSQEVSYYVK